MERWTTKPCNAYVIRYMFLTNLIYIWPVALTRRMQLIRMQKTQKGVSCYLTETEMHTFSRREIIEILSCLVGHPLLEMTMLQIRIAALLDFFIKDERTSHYIKESVALLSVEFIENEWYCKKCAPSRLFILSDPENWAELLLTWRYFCSLSMYMFFGRN